jgi:hypothetical protein
MRWPATPDCHDAPATWKGPCKEEPYRFCSYCNGIHPKDFVERVMAGKLGDVHWYNVHLLDTGYDEEAMLQLLAAIRVTEVVRLRDPKAPDSK